MLETGDAVGDYKLVKFLGRGQFGEVWLAEKKLQFSTRSVRHALKFLPSPEDETSLKNIEDEVDTWIEAGSHPNVMSVIDMFVSKNNIVIISDFAEGGSLGNWLKLNGGKAPNEEIALEMMSGILRGIEHLHQRKIVHRDLKPDNILLQGNFPRIADFGISRIVSSGTLSTKPIGSPAYMSPEAFNGNKSSQTDIWSAGVILYELLTGNQPYEDEVLWLLIKKIQEEEPKILPDSVRPEIRAIVEKTLQKDSTKRFQTANEMRQEIERALHHLKSGDYEIKNSDIVQKHVSTEKIEPKDHMVLYRADEETIADLDVSNNESKETVLNLSHKDSNEITANETVKFENQSNEKTFFKPAEDENILKETQFSPVTETDRKEIEKTIDWQESERAKGEEQQAEILKIGDEIKHRNQTSESFETKKGAGFYLGIFGGIIGLCLIGFVVWQFSNEKTVAVSNSADTNSSIETKTAIPTAPKGMAYVTGDEFSMGRNDSESVAEKPAHKVSVKSFFMDVYETANGQFIDYLLRNPTAKMPRDWKRVSNAEITFPGRKTLETLDTFPVVGVDWNQAGDFCKEAGKRLPTEEEWEFAARGTQSFIYPWGNDWKEGIANVEGDKFWNVERAIQDTSPFGIHDMSGNAWEWTSSDFKAYPNGKIPDAFVGKPNLKTIRGGSFESTRYYATTTYRIGWQATGAENYNRTGFRCVQDIK